MQQALGNEWIHDVYRCAMEEQPWEVALRPLMAELRATCAGVVKHSIAPTGAEVLLRVDVDPGTEQAYVQTYVHQNPVMNCLSAMPLGHVTTGSGAVDERFYFSSEFYNSWQKPSGYADNMGISLARRNGQFVMLSLPRDFDAGLYSREEISAVLPYVQHLVRAFNIWLRLTSTEAHAGWVSEAFDQLAQGLIIIGDDRVILYANKGGEKILSDIGPLQRTNFRLRIKDETASDKIDAILRLFESGEASETTDYAVAVPRGPARSPLFLRVQPPLGLRPGQRTFGLPKAVAFLHVVDPDERQIQSLAAFSQAYGLTGAEQRLAEALVRIESIVDAARAVGVSEATGRTQMQSIYAKTGARSLAGLLAQIYRNTLP
ncbi:MAG: helix-turn-helix transcriptional regulator [Phreatobacter sp.]|uniref:helix-turn-helix transcriptional regulator n=1 Tax=Phreatobacter sp. TaxID=1966341 RepID=UPI0040373554